MKRLSFIAAPLLTLCLPAAAQQPPSLTPSSVVEASAPGEWRTIAAEDLLVMELAPDAAGKSRQVVIQLLPAPFSQPWVENIRTLAGAHWWDGTSVYRVVDNWVAQWGDGEDEKSDPKPLPEGLNVAAESDYVSAVSEDRALRWIDETIASMSGDQTDSAKHPIGLMYDIYAKSGVFIDGWPVGSEGARMWPTHCYASVGVARDLSPDTGTGAELYAVIGHAPRQLDRNIAVVGRVIEGIAHFSTLPRGTGDAGVYETEPEHTPILSVRLASELPAAEQPRIEYLDTDSESFAAYVTVRANRLDDFYKVPAGGVDICNVQVPIRRVGASH